MTSRRSNRGGKTRGGARRKGTLEAASAGEPPEPNTTNEAIAEVLEELGQFERDKGERFKGVAYERAAHVIASQDHPIHSGEEAKELPGVGKGIAERIDEYLTTGHVRQLEKERKDPTLHAIHELEKVPGIGPKTAQRLVHEGYKSVEDLREHPELLKSRASTGLKYVEDFDKRVPRAAAEHILEAVLKCARRVDKDLQCFLCGEFRRGKPDAAEIDILLTHAHSHGHGRGGSEATHLTDLVRELHSAGVVVDDLTHEGNLRYSGVCVEPPQQRGAEHASSSQERTDSAQRYRLNFRFVPHDSLATGLLYFTGSAQFNHSLRILARSKGFMLNDYGLFHLDSNNEQGEPVHVREEEDVFNALGLPYYKPADREHEIVADVGSKLHTRHHAHAETGGTHAHAHAHAHGHGGH